VVRDKYDTGTDDFLLKLDINNIETEWSAPTEFPDLTKHKTIAIDLETRDDGLAANKGPGWATNDGYVVGIAVAAGDFHGYFPIRHANGPNLDRKMTLGWLQEQMDTPGITKVCHNAPYDIGWLMAEGIKVQGPIIDTLIAAPLVDENRFSYRLELLGKEYIGMRKDEKVLRAAATEWGIDPKAEMWKLPARFVGGYGEQDAVMTLKLWEHLKAEIEKQDLWSVFDLESRVLPGVIDMRARGVRVDLDQADRSRKILRQRKQELLAFVKDKTGIEVEVWAAESIKKVFEDLGLPYPRTEAGAPSFTKDFLKDHPNEVAQTINKIREADKADSTFIDSILKYEHKGRIHCEMHQLRSDDGGTVTGRFSSSSPNLQQIPARDPEIKKLIRGIFVPEEGERWGSFDYASQEPRLLTHFAASLPPRMRGTMVDEIVKEFHEGNADLHQMVADMAGISRKEAKTVNLGIMYGMG
jgi:DNA polymerase I-like protein with 3'-5' exonuclease and polymerase domains